MQRNWLQTKRWLIHGILYAIYFLGVIEASTRLLFSIRPVFRSVIGRDDASSQRLRWVARHSINAGSPEYGFDVYDPMRGWALAPKISEMPVFNKKVLNSTSREIRGCGV